MRCAQGVSQVPPTVYPLRLPQLSPCSPPPPHPPTGATLQTLTGVDGDTAFTFEVVPAAEGEVTVIMAINTATDRAANPSTVSNSLGFRYDITDPAPTLIGSLAWAITKFSPIALRVDFDELVQVLPPPPCRSLRRLWALSNSNSTLHPLFYLRCGDN
jgi:hypothetical protein